ncbi:MAG: HPF/RaiA family ribosome-associated protein [Actinomycetota bacterium]
MQLRVSSPGKHLKDADIDRIQRDLEKIDRRLSRFREVYAEVRVSNGTYASPSFDVTLEIEYGRNHLIAKASNPDVGAGVREAREEILRQINDSSRRGSHTRYAKKRR